MTKRYDGSIAVITGVSSGIGRTLALTLAERGATVVGLARRQELLDELSAELTVISPASSTIKADVGDSVALQSHLASIEAQHGRIDILINNAGIDPDFDALGGDDSVVREVMEINFFGAVTGTLAVLPAMVKRGSGIIVNVSSDTARAPEPGESIYAASKAGLSAFTDSVSHEAIRHGVYLHLLYPGWVPTAMGAANASLPPKTVRRSAQQVATLVAERMGRRQVDINAARLPLMAPIMRTIAPLSYQRAMRKMSTTGV